MSFIDRVDSIQIAERNIRRVQGLEMEQVNRMIKHYKRARLELLDGLSTTPRGTFTEAQKMAVMAQIDSILFALKAKTRRDISFGTETLTEQSIEDSLKEVNRFEKEFAGVNQLIPFDAINATMLPNNLLINRFESSINAYNNGLREEIQRELIQSLIQKRSLYQTIGAIDVTMNQNEWKVARIVRTELHNAYNVGKQESFKQIKEGYAPDLKKTLIHPIDGRTGADSLSLARNPLIVDIDKPFKYKWNGQVRTFMAPPDRPNDRAILIPYRKSWG